MRKKIRVENKRIELPLEFLEEWASGQTDGWYVLGIKKWYKQRSKDQNNYYWGVVIETLCEYTGYTPDEMHDCLKRKFLKSMEDQFGFEHTQSTRSLTTTEFEEYIENIKIFASVELSCYIPDPE